LGKPEVLGVVSEPAVKRFCAQPAVSKPIATEKTPRSPMICKAPAYALSLCNGFADEAGSGASSSLSLDEPPDTLDEPPFPARFFLDRFSFALDPDEPARIDCRRLIKDVPDTPTGCVSTSSTLHES
jgi:hypothetical protein